MQDTDRRFMALALGLGRRGQGNAWPNPAVGCALHKDRRIIGRGWTAPGGRPHAETQALAQAGAAAAGATAYVTLEPCAHHGQTPPCAAALVAAGVARVVVATRDDDPRVSGRGLQMLRDAGINARAIAGQWAHNYPDQPDRHSELGSGYGQEAYPNMSRMDWAVELYQWFNYYLKDIGEEPESMVQIQTHDGQWHVEETWPPADMSWLPVALDAAEGDGGTVNANNQRSFRLAALEEPAHISGMPTLHLSVDTLTCQGGQIFATMYADGLRIGHATMDVRYRDGGHEAKTTFPLSSYLMLMEFNPMDVNLQAGAEIEVVLTESGEDYLPSPCAAIGLNVNLDASSTLSLPLIDRPADENMMRSARPIRFSYGTKPTPRAARGTRLSTELSRLSPMKK